MLAWEKYSISQSKPVNILCEQYFSISTTREFIPREKYIDQSLYLCYFHSNKLWLYCEIFEALLNTKGTNNIEVISSLKKKKMGSQS